MQRVFLLLCFFFALISAKDATKHYSKKQAWQKSVEEILSSIVLGPLSDIFEPSFLAKRIRQDALTMQKNRLRAHLVGTMLRSVDTFIRVRPLDGMCQEAIDAIVNEFNAHKFHMHFIDGYIFCPIPPPPIR